MSVGKFFGGGFSFMAHTRWGSFLSPVCRPKAHTELMRGRTSFFYFSPSLCLIHSPLFGNHCLINIQLLII